MSVTLLGRSLTQPARTSALPGAHQYKVVGINSRGGGPPSAVVTVVVAAQQAA